MTSYAIYPGIFEQPSNFIFTLNIVGLQGFKTRCSAAERNVWARIQGGKLSERPIVRVLDAPVHKRFVRRAEGQAAGRPFFGSFLWSEQRNEHIVLGLLH
jgi:hypothetical protein